MQEDRHERSGLLRLHKDPRADNERDDRHTLARRSRCGATQRLRSQRQRQDEERRPEIAERREVSRGRQRKRVPRVLVPAVASGADTRRDREKHGADGEREREPIRPEQASELRRSRSRDVRVDPILLEEPRSKADVVRGAVGHQEGADGECRGSDQTSGYDWAPTARRDIEEEKRERQELEADGRGQEQSPRKRTVAEAPRGEREAEREEIHVAEGHLEYEAEKEDVARSGPRAPERRKLADERDPHRGGGRDLQGGPDRERDRVGQNRERNEKESDDRQIAELVGQAEDRVGAGIKRPAVQEMLPGEPVRAEVVSGRKCAGNYDRGAEREHSHDDARGPDDAAT